MSDRTHASTRILAMLAALALPALPAVAAEAANPIAATDPSAGSGYATLLLMRPSASGGTLTLERLDGAGTPTARLQLAELGAAYSSHHKVFGGALLPGTYRIAQVALHNGHLDGRFVSADASRFTVEADKRVDLGRLYERNVDGDVAELLRSDRPLCGAKADRFCLNLPVAARTLPAGGAWIATPSAAEIEATKRERSQVLHLGLMAEAEDGSWWVAGGLGGVFRRALDGSWQAYWLPGEESLEWVDPLSDGTAFVWGEHGTFARVGPAGTEYLADLKLETGERILGMRCTTAAACMIALAVPIGNLRFIHRSNDTTKKLDEIPVPGGVMNPKVRDAERFGAGLLVYTNPELWYADPATGAITSTKLTGRGKTATLSVTGSRIAIGSAYSDDAGATWLKAKTRMMDTTPSYRADGTMLLQGADLEGYASFPVRYVSVSSNLGKEWRDGAQVVQGELFVGARSKDIFMIEGVHDDLANGLLFTSTWGLARGTESTLYVSHDDGASWQADTGLYDAAHGGAR